MFSGLGCDADVDELSQYEVPFFTLGKIYTWGLRCELFQYSDEDIDTGITEVDAIEVNYANAISVNVAEGGSGDFVAEEIVTGGNSNVTATVKSWNSATRQLVVYNRSGIFAIPETLTGNTSSAAWNQLITNPFKCWQLTHYRIIVTNTH